LPHVRLKNVQSYNRHDAFIVTFGCSMKRREFIRLLGGAVVTWPFAAHAQQRAALPVIGFLDPRSSNGSFSGQIDGFRRGLRDIGFVENENVVVEYAWGLDQSDRLPTLAADLVKRPIAVLVASGGSQVAVIAKAATTTIPVVFAVGHDPVKLDLVVSPARPGGNATGINYFNAEPHAKRLELIGRLLPQRARVAVLVNPADAATAEATLRELGAAARSLRLETMIFNASSSKEVDAAFADIASIKADALYVGDDVFLQSRRDQIVTLASRAGLPTAYPQREWVEAGGLMSYGTSFPNVYRLIGTYAGLILKGEPPSDLPIIQPSKFEFVINLKTAKTLGVTVPPALLSLASEVIQ
jgi:putative ABC transport system substrate-binding protein